LRAQLTNQITSLEQENSRLRRDYDEIQSRRQNDSGSANQNNQVLVDRARRQVTDEYERKIKSIEEAHRRELERISKEHQQEIKKTMISATLKSAPVSQQSGGSSESIENVRKQLTDDFDRRLKRIQDDHNAQIEKIRTEHQQAMSKNRVGQQQQQDSGELERENKKLGDKIKIL